MTACALFVFDRPYYLEQTLESLERQTYKDVDWFAFVDGTECSTMTVGNSRKRTESINILTESDIKFEEVFIATRNKGMGKQKLFAHSLFDYYDDVIFFEDDMIVSKHYIEVLLNLRNLYPEYEMITACDRHNDLTPEDFTPENLPITAEYNTHFWGYYLTKNAASFITPTLTQYCELVGNNYRKRPGDKIRQTFNVKATSHDGILEKCLKENNFKRLTTKLPRAKYIGKYGMHCNPGVFKHFFDHPYEWEEEPFKNDDY